MVSGGYFSTAAHTETGGIHEFLHKLRPQVSWTRCFPAVSKSAPKLNRPHPVPVAAQSGTTGQRLVDSMLRILRDHYRGAACSFDFVVLIDDADCRFAGAADPGAAFLEWEADLAAQVRAAADKPSLGFHALLAWPEVETWLLADFAHSFTPHYRPIAHPLRKHIETCILSPLTWEQIEQFGGRLQNGTCEHKLSAALQASFTATTACACSLAVTLSRLTDGMPYRYSKQVDGPLLLKRTDPDRVALSAPRFRAAQSRLRSLHP